MNIYPQSRHFCRLVNTRWIFNTVLLLLMREWIFYVSLRNVGIILWKQHCHTIHSSFLSRSAVAAERLDGGHVGVVIVVDSPSTTQLRYLPSCPVGTPSPPLQTSRLDLSWWTSALFVVFLTDLSPSPPPCKLGNFDNLKLCRNIFKKATTSLQGFTSPVKRQ